MSGMMMKIAHARNEAQLSSGPACKNKEYEENEERHGDTSFLG